MKIASIDVGFNNLGLVVADVNSETYTIETIIHIEKIDLAKLIHKRIARQACDLFHTNNMCDRISHFVQEYGPLIHMCEKLLIERQPPGGFWQCREFIDELF